MSIKCMHNVWQHAELDGTELLALLALADWADDEGSCYPGYNKLATKIRRNRRTAIRVIESLVKSGEITKAEGRGVVTPFGNTNRYTLAARYVNGAAERGDTDDTPTDVGGDTHDTSRGDTHDTHIRQENSQRTTPPTPQGGSAEPDHDESPHSWSALDAAVSEALGGASVLNKRTGQPLGWMGQLRGILGKAADDDVRGAVEVWWRFVRSDQWQYRPRKLSDLPATVGSWVRENGIAVTPEQASRYRSIVHY